MTNSEVVTVIPFPNKREAQIAFDVLRIDTEPKRSFIEKSLKLEDDNHLLVTFGGQAKHVRVGVTSFFESLILCCETLAQFGPPQSDQYLHFCG
ncbi:EKC/KEOPS complex subunit Lage3 isoform X2 [Toxorhynchites rutilus septentrionalis]|uniref:EKC/KEOPS complex subunit Lage3 isoform X2 n=1 Tax=Toxorhynchites rutilus septentrionalis TaxID=329112 RepID=UPI0024787037|nr:EKC/KEOPS complex subunit Lage3 isoform X2 [Toxorhynchites rutilus septentrionalis]